MSDQLPPTPLTLATTAAGEPVTVRLSKLGALTVTGPDREHVLHQVFAQLANSPLVQFVTIGAAANTAPLLPRSSASADPLADRTTAQRLLGQVESVLFRRREDPIADPTPDEPLLVLLVTDGDHLLGHPAATNLAITLALLGANRRISSIWATENPVAALDEHAAAQVTASGGTVTVNAANGTMTGALEAPDQEQVAALAAAATALAQPLRGVTLGATR